jgi:hypothetical protein
MTGDFVKAKELFKDVNDYFSQQFGIYHPIAMTSLY